MDLNVRLNVTASYSVTLSMDAGTLYGDRLKGVVAEHIHNLMRDGALPDCIDKIEIAEVSDGSDLTIIRGTNA